MISCAIYGCTNNTSTNTDPTIQYYYFPKHPVMAQQWIAACWRAEQIDINTARICSIHFANDNYTSQYKMLDYLGMYTKILKYDAVPTLFLPNPHTSVIIKQTIEGDVHVEPELIDAHEIKQIMVYEVQPVHSSASDSNFESSPVTEYIEPEGQPTLVPVDIKFEEQNKIQEPVLATNSKCDENVEYSDEKYEHIVNKQQLQNLQESNNNLKKKIHKLEEIVAKLEVESSVRLQLVKKKDEELKRFEKQFDHLKRTTLSLTDEKTFLSKVFSESQIKILSGKKKIYWSNDDMAMGYTIRHLSNKRCYLYLTKNLNIPLPALSSIKRWATLKKNEFETNEKKEENKFEDDDSE